MTTAVPGSRAAQRVGIVGCGNISEIYLRNAPLFRTFEVVCCADIRSEAAKALATRFGLAAASVSDLLARDDIDIVLNLTSPPPNRIFRKPQTRS
jgi:predicted dehydrogenase